MPPLLNSLTATICEAMSSQNSGHIPASSPSIQSTMHRGTSVISVPNLLQKLPLMNQTIQAVSEINLVNVWGVVLVMQY